MASFNRVILMGNLTRDPQVRYVPSGTAVTELGLAINRSWFDKQSQQRKEETTFVDVTLWGRQAEIAGEYLSKGRSVMIEGRLQLDTWDDRESGQKRSKLKVVCENMTMIGGRNEGGGGGGGGGGSRSYGGGGGGGRGADTRSSGGAGEGQGGYESSPDQSFYDDAPGGGDDVPF
ncbi:MAG: single-stranded DNA-binding protein [Planctomycetaceae bacterium]|nr:single-stranded DNA-binding protein [Planctomycetaceae bacterium]